MSTLKTQIWTDQIQKNFYPETSFLKYAKDFSEFVDNDIINLAESGADPDVLINNTTYPIAVKQREDTPIAVELDLYETENTLVRYPEAVEYSYDKLDSVIYGHKQSLLLQTSKKAAHDFAPDSDSDFTPVISTSGTVDNGFKRLTFQDILKLKRSFDMKDIPSDKRFLVLDPRHTEDLMLQDLEVFKDILDLQNGAPRRFAGFNILEFTKNPTFDSLTLEKRAFGQVEDANTCYSSFAFHADEVMKADGNYKIYERGNDPELRGTVIGFDKRFIAQTIRSKGIGAIVAKKA